MGIDRVLQVITRQDNVSVEQAMTMNAVLKEYDKDVELKLYEGDMLSRRKVMIIWLIGYFPINCLLVCAYRESVYFPFA